MTITPQTQAAQQALRVGAEGTDGVLVPGTHLSNHWVPDPLFIPYLSGVIIHRFTHIEVMIFDIDIYIYSI